MITRIKQAVKSVFSYESSPEKVAFATSVAVYIAFSPFCGLHMIMSVISGIFLRLNVPLLLSLGWVINNPLTMVPIYTSGYFFGHWLLHWHMGISVVDINPTWMAPLNTFLHSYIGLTDVSFWAWLIGGNILGILLAFIAYPVMHKIMISSAQQSVF